MHGALAYVPRGRSLASTLVRPTAFHGACSCNPFPNLASRRRAVHGQTPRLAVQRSAGFLRRFRFAICSVLELQMPRRLPHNASTAKNITTVVPQTFLPLRDRKGARWSPSSITGFGLAILSGQGCLWRLGVPLVGARPALLGVGRQKGVCCGTESFGGLGLLQPLQRLRQLLPYYYSYDYYYYYYYYRFPYNNNYSYFLLLRLLLLLLLRLLLLLLLPPLLLQLLLLLLLLLLRLLTAPSYSYYYY